MQTSFQLALSSETGGGGRGQSMLEQMQVPSGNGLFLPSNKRLNNLYTCSIGSLRIDSGNKVFRFFIYGAITSLYFKN